MIALVEGSERQRTPNEIALNVLLGSLTVDLRGGRRDALLPRRLQRRPPVRDRADRPAGLPDPDHHRRAALRDRHRRHGPAGTPQRAGDVRPRGRGGRRRRRTPARQDRHHHLRQPAGHRAAPLSTASAREELAEAALLSSLADETPEGRSIVALVGGARRGAGRGRARGVLGHHPDERARPSGTARSARARLGGDGLGRRHRRPSSTGSWSRSAPRAVRRSSSPTPAGCSASSTSRTSSRTASASASTRCARWASAP